MYRFSFVESVSGKAREVSRQLFHEIISREDIKRKCKQIADIVNTPQEQENSKNEALSLKGRAGREAQVSSLKRSLPAFCWHAWFDDGKRKNACAHASGLIMIDVDHVEDPRSLFASIADKAKAMGLLVAHITPSTKGLRLVFPVPEGMYLVTAQSHYAHELNLQVDACTKDLARLSFAVPEEYFLYLDEEGLWTDLSPRSPLQGEGCNTAASAPADSAVSSAGAASSVARGIPSLLSPPLHGGEEKDNSSLNNSSCEEMPASKTSSSTHEEMPASKTSSSTHEEMPSSNTFSPARGGDKREGMPQETHESQASYDLEYDGIPYRTIVSCLSTLLGGTPAHGSRNNFIFSMAAYLRYVCNDDPNWIASILPTYGETQSKWRRTIESACSRAQYKVMPNIVKRALDMAKHQVEIANHSEDEEQNELPPAMPQRLPRLIRLLTKNVPDVCKPAVANAVFPALGAHLHGVKFWLKDGTEKEATFMCVTMAPQSSGKSAVNKPIEYITADIEERDEVNRKREQEWKDASANKGANKEKPKRPDDLCVQVLVSDMTNAAFVQRMKDAGDHYLYTNLEELDLLKQLQTNGTKDVGKIICLCFDNGKYGQERVGTQSVTARVDLRWNWNASSTIQKGLEFFKGRLVDGTLSRINFCTIIRDRTKPFVYGHYDEKYAEDLKPFIANLNLANGHIECKQALDLANKLQQQCEDNAALADDDTYQELAYRAVTIAYLKAMVLYIAQDMTWSKDIAEFVEWSLQYDMWCKMHFFGDQIAQEQAKEKVKRCRGRHNLLDMLPNPFTFEDVVELRRAEGLPDEGSRHMVCNWTHRGYVEYDYIEKNYIKTTEYLSRSQAA